MLTAVGGGPAHVFGSSGGAQVALNLAARHPEKARTVVAHEPPAVELLPDAAEHRARSQEVYDTYRSDGLGAAMQKFLAGAGLDGDHGGFVTHPGPFAEKLHAVLSS